METTRLSSNGQIILPKAVRDAHHWTPGTDFSVEDTGDGVLLRPIKAGQPTRLADVVGSLRIKGPARTAEEMDSAIRAELCDRRDRGRYYRHCPPADRRRTSADRTSSPAVRNRDGQAAVSRVAVAEP